MIHDAYFGGSSGKRITNHQWEFIDAYYFTEKAIVKKVYIVFDKDSYGNMNHIEYGF